MLTLGAAGNGGATVKMKRYWQFAVVGVICLLVALLWAQPARSHADMAARVAATSAPQKSAAPAGSQAPTASSKSANPSDGDDQPLPGSSSSLPLLAVIGFGVLAGGITSAMRTR